MRTARDVIAEQIMWAKAKMTDCNHALADDALRALDAASYVICRKGDPEAYRDLGFVVWASETPLPKGAVQFKRDGNRIGYIAVDESEITKP